MKPCFYSTVVVMLPSVSNQLFLLLPFVVTAIAFQMPLQGGGGIQFHDGSLAAGTTACYKCHRHVVKYAPFVAKQRRSTVLPRSPSSLSSSSTSAAGAQATGSKAGGLQQLLTSEQIQALSRDDYVVITNFISDDLVTELQEDVAQLRSSSKFRVARIGQDSTNTLNEDIRVAETCFVGKGKLSDTPNGAREELYDVLDGVRGQLSSNPILSSSGDGAAMAPALDGKLSELLYAYYPQGGYYRRHRDSVTGSASVLRAYSLLLYLNKDWKPEDGGKLRMHFDSGGDFLPDDEQPNFLDVEPRGGTLVLFKSDKIPHEVLDTRSSRLAVVGWYNRPMSSSDIADLSSEGDKIRVYMLMASAALVTVGVASIVMS